MSVLHPADKLLLELVQTIDKSETEDEEDILNALANLLAQCAQRCAVSPATVLTNLGQLMGAKDVHVETVLVPKGDA